MSVIRNVGMYGWVGVILSKTNKTAQPRRDAQGGDEIRRACPIIWDMR